MNVTMVTPYPPPIDGIGVHAQNVIESLSDGTTVSVLTRRGIGNIDDAIAVHRVLSSNPLCMVNVLRSLRVERPDSIHFQFNLPALGISWLWAMLGAMVERRRRGVQLIFTLHEVRRDVDLLGPMGVVMFKLIDRISDSLIVYTEEARALLVVRCHTSEAKITVMPHGSPEVFTRPTPDQHADLFDRYRLRNPPILFIGFIHPDKGVRCFIEALFELQEASPALFDDIEVLVAGAVRKRSGIFVLFERKDRRYEDDLRSQVHQHKLDSIVKFTGFVPAEDLPSLLCSARFAVLPYLNTTQSGVLNLLLAARTPVITSSLPGLVETMGDAALYAPPGDAHALAREMERLLTNDALRDELITRMGHVHNDVKFSSIGERLSVLYGQSRTGGGAR